MKRCLLQLILHTTVAINELIYQEDYASLSAFDLQNISDSIKNYYDTKLNDDSMIILLAV